MRGRRAPRFLTILAWMGIAGTLQVLAQQVTVTGRVDVREEGVASGRSDNSGVLVWLETAGNTSLPGNAWSQAGGDRHLRLTQRNKTFEPHLLIVPVGATVEFPNRDPFFHNVFSLFEGKRFDLGLYEAGTSRNVHFDKPGISYIFCNIHSQMSAVVVALSTPYYAISDKSGQFAIANVYPGRYVLRLWAEGAAPEALEGLSRAVRVGDENRTLGVLKLSVSPLVTLTHKNKYGRDYDPPTPDSPAYTQP
ncbi:MAG TPA: carboxypeptidase regulatory-like domain-containing protein [Terriglobales bacterium]|nr:carboxypeptidase regulatory-like domain-containing protein [Terriglobales bacterium]